MKACYNDEGKVGTILIKLIVSDLDGTLLGFDKRMKNEDKRAIQFATEQGIDLAIASGRMDNEILDVLKELQQKAHRVSQNGAFIYTKTNLRLHAVTFPPQLAQQIYQQAKEWKAIVLVCDENAYFIEETNEYTNEIEKRLFYGLYELPNMLDAIGKDIHPSKITVLAEDEQIVEFEQKITNQFGNHVDAFISEPRCLDIMPKNISKGNAILALIKHLRVQPHEIACFGDAFNDIPMFRLTPYSFAMSHAHPAVKKEAQYVVHSVSEGIQMILTNASSTKMMQQKLAD
jgi:Cof subfamily protein (haloacid dehalogenase superfamily)